MDSKLLTVAELSEVAKVVPRQVLRWIAAKRFPSVRYGSSGDWRVPDSPALNRFFLQRGCIPPAHYRAAKGLFSNSEFRKRLIDASRSASGFCERTGWDKNTEGLLRAMSDVIGDPITEKEWWGMPIGQLVKQRQKLFDLQKSLARDNELLAVLELRAQGHVGKITQHDLAKQLGISGTTLKSRLEKNPTLSARLETMCKSMGAPDVTEKDSRAKRLYKNQVLQDTEPQE